MKMYWFNLDIVNGKLIEAMIGLIKSNITNDGTKHKKSDIYYQQ